MNYTIIVHGGAWNIPLDMHQDHLRGIEKALGAGIKLAKSGLDAVTCVVEIVKILELDPTFDAGCGSFLNRDGEVEMDAIVMDGRDLSAGAVAAIQNVQHPVEVANHIRMNTEHLMLVGTGATKYAHANAFEFYPTEKLLVGRELERYKELQKKKILKTRKFFEHDTVGAVVRDIDGNIAVATSTGGTPHKLPGRVGDSPVIGAGAYADNEIGGASATGWGESLLKILAAKSTLDFISQGNSSGSAAQKVIDQLEIKADGRGGVICIDHNGVPAFSYNTPYMARGIANQDGIVSVEI